MGTAVVTRHDGRLALGRLGALCEQVAVLIQTFIMVYQLVKSGKILSQIFVAMQVKELNALGYEVIIVTSGAVGVGKQRLKYRKLVNSSFADLQKPQMELDGKACAAVGQSGLMALYDMLFTQVCLLTCYRNLSTVLCCVHMFLMLSFPLCSLMYPLPSFL